MTKEQTTVIPEELYNLTKLAEVAAERLNTTDKIEAKDFNRHSNNLLRTTMETLNMKENQKNHHDVVAIEKPDVLTKDIRSLEQQKQQITAESASESASASLTLHTMNITTKTENRSSITAFDAYHHNHHHPHHQHHNNYHQHHDHHQHDNNHHHHHYNANVMATFYSSSDDDSNYYSHKVFDRKKLRRSTISDNSRYDEHSSCSSNPGCSSSSSSSSIGGCSADEQQYSQIHHDLDLDGGSGDIASLQQIHIDSCAGSNLNLLDDEHICPECGKKYSTSSNLARHRQTHRLVSLLTITL